jgi:microcystin-dependent protein
MKKYTPLPPELSGEVITRPITIDKALMPFVAGALEWLTDYEPFDETDPDLTVIEARELFGEMLWAFYHEEVTAMQIGLVAHIGTVTTPDKWLPCDGSEVNQATFPKLYAVVGNSFGSADTGKFRLPDLRYRSPMGTGGLSGAPTPTVAIGEFQGTYAVALNDVNLPASKAQLQNSAGNPAYRHTGVAGARASIAAASGTTNSLIPHTTENLGAAIPFGIVHPVQGIPAYIYAGE